MLKACPRGTSFHSESSEVGLSLTVIEQGGPVTSDRLVEEFGLLHTNAKKFLQESGCTAQSLLVCVMDIKWSVESSTLKELEAASSVNDVFHVLKKRNLISALHYNIMKHIIINLCTECKDLQKGLNHFEASFKAFAETPIHKSCTCREERFEVLKGTELEDNTDLVITADDGNTSYADILDLENIIVKAFRCSKAVLHIQHIELQPPHVTLIYGLPCSIVDSIFPLTLEEWAELRSHSISEIHCRECHYMLDEKGSTQYIICSSVLIMTLLSLKNAEAADTLMEFVDYDKLCCSKGIYRTNRGIQSWANVSTLPTVHRLFHRFW